MSQTVQPQVQPQPMPYIAIPAMTWNAIVAFLRNGGSHNEGFMLADRANAESEIMQQRLNEELAALRTRTEEDGFHRGVAEERRRLEVQKEFAAKPVDLPASFLDPNNDAPLQPLAAVGNDVGNGQQQPPHSAPAINRAARRHPERNGATA